MATYDHIFIKTGLELGRVAETFAGLLELRLYIDPGGDFYLTRPASEGKGVIGGQLHRNFYEYPSDEESEQSLIAEYDTVWKARCAPCTSEVQRREAIKLFEDVAACSPWPVLILGGLDVLLGLSRLQEPIHWFPPGATPDAKDRSVWLPFAADS